MEVKYKYFYFNRDANRFEALLLCDKPIPTWLVLTYVKYGVTSFGVPTESVTVTGPYEW